MHAIYFSYKIKNPTFNELSMVISVTQVLRRPRLVSPVFSCHGQTFSSAAAGVKSTRDTGDYDSYYHYETQRPRHTISVCGLFKPGTTRESMEMFRGNTVTLKISDIKIKDYI